MSVFAFVSLDEFEKAPFSSTGGNTEFREASGFGTVGNWTGGTGGGSCD